MPALLGLLVAAGTACAQQTIRLTPDAPEPRVAGVPRRPGAASRVVKVFDFEEHDTNPGEVPEYWFRAQTTPTAPRPGFPDWNKADLSYASESGIAASGTGSVRLPTSGGSVSLRLGQGVLPVFAGTDYAVTAKVRTEGLTHARAILAARFLDEAGQPVVASESRSEPAVSPGAWKVLTTQIRGDFEHAAYIQIELLLLQPEQQQRGPAPSHALWAQDYKGAAWFDEVAVAQLPRVELSTMSPGNVVVQPDQPTLRLLVRDLTGEPLQARLRVIDAEGRTVDALDRPLGENSTTTTWKPALTRLGWYRATMDIATASGQSVGMSEADFVWLGAQTPDTDAAARSDRGRFSLMLDEAPEGLLTQLPGLCRKLGITALTLPVWESGLTLDLVQARTDALSPVVDTLLAARTQVTLSFPCVPDGLAAAQQVDRDDPAPLLSASPDRWMAWARPMLDRFGQHVERWQVGGAAPMRVPVTEDRSPAAISAAFSSMVSGPRIAMALDAGKDAPAPTRPGLYFASLPRTLGATVARGVGVRAAAMPTGGELTLVVPASSPGTGSAQSLSASETVRRAVRFWAGACAAGDIPPSVRLALGNPWNPPGHERGSASPRVELAAWSAVMGRLAGRRIIGEYPVIEGCTAYILEPAAGSAPGRTGALAAWRHRDAVGETAIVADLGDGQIEVVDVFGNRTPAPPPTPGRGNSRPLTRIALTTSPVFIEGVDTELLRLVSGIAIEPSVIEPGIEQREHAIVIHNPWGQTINGRLTILEPGGFESGEKDRAWRISPRTQRFSVEPGKQTSLPFQLAFSAAEEVGLKPFVLSMDLTAGKDYGTIEVRRMLDVQAHDVGVELTASVEGDAVIVDAALTNRTDVSMSLEVTAFAESLPRMRTSISDLSPGSTLSKRFVFAKAAPLLAGKRVLVSIVNAESKVRINKSVAVP